MFTKILYAGAGLWLLFSFSRDRAKTRKALKKAWKSFENILPSILTVLILIGFILTLLDAETISGLLGADSGIIGLCIAAVIGSLTLIPGFVAIPLAASLLQAGAGYAQISIFISTLMMVGIVTFPVEAKFFGRHTAVKRNVFAFAAAVITSLVIGVVMR